MKTNDSIYANSHRDFLSKLLSEEFVQWRKCTYSLDNGYKIWMIRLNGEVSPFGFANKISDGGNTVSEIYVGNPKDRLPSHKEFPTETRLIFDILDGPYGGREYVFRGVFCLDSHSDNNHRIWKKVSDQYYF